MADEKKEGSKILNLLSCPICGVTMTLTQITPGDPGFERLTFRCAACHSSETIVVSAKQDQG